MSILRIRVCIIYIKENKIGNLGEFEIFNKSVNIDPCRGYNEKIRDVRINFKYNEQC